MVLDRRRGQQRAPLRIGLRRRVAVVGGEPDRGDGAPEVVVQLRVPAGDVGIGHRDVEQREGARALRKVLLVRARHDARDAVPAGVGELVPERRVVRLVGRAARIRPVAAAVLHFLERARVLGAAEWRRRGDAELLGRAQRKGRHAAPLRQRDGGRTRHEAVFARLAAFAVRVAADVVVVGALHQDGGGHVAAEIGAELRRAADAGVVRRLAQRGLQQVFLRRVQRQQHVMRGGHRGQRGIGVAHPCHRAVARVLRRDGIDGVVHRQMHHRQCARCGERIGIAIRGRDDLVRGGVPVEHQLVAALGAPG